MIDKVLLLIVLLAIGVIVTGFVTQNIEISEQNKLKRFSSYAELKNFLETNTQAGYYRGGLEASFSRGSVAPVSQDLGVSTPEASDDYSTTNIQVSGVDEADIVKTDGKYIYAVYDEGIVILDAYPAENARIVAEINSNDTINEIFVNGDRLISFGQKYENYYTEYGELETSIVPRYYLSQTFVNVYDISDRSNPVLKRNVSLEGNYFDSRMIGDYVYLIANQPVYSGSDPIPMPTIYYGNLEREIPATDIYYFDVPDSAYIYTNILSINTQDDAEDFSVKTFLMGYTQNMYVSTNNMYIVYTKRLNQIDFYDRIIDKAILPYVPSDIRSKINEIRNSNLNNYEKLERIGEEFENYFDSLNPEEAANLMKIVENKTQEVLIEITKEMEKTVIHKISISNGNIEYQANGEVPGNVLNQFSMDENDSYFRITTTTGNSGGGNSLNHLYVLDDSLKIVGKVEDLAKGESIYSTRFIGDRAYVVTFKKIDPLFVIDLSNPQEPEVLGYLKVTGYSDYLHPYDENHVIGLGKETAGGNENFAWYQGVKISLFDVSDVQNPVEMGKIEIGDRGTDSEALRDHKAFLFDREKNLLVIPVSLAEINITYYENQYTTVPDWAYGDIVWKGAYVFNVDLTDGIVLKGRITHTNETIDEINYYNYPYQIRRSLYIDNVLYTISGKMIKMNDLDDLSEINRIDLP